MFLVWFSNVKKTILVLSLFTLKDFRKVVVSCVNIVGRLVLGCDIADSNRDRF